MINTDKILKENDFMLIGAYENANIKKGELHELIKMLREAEKDAARMNWLESNGFSIEMADYNHISCNRDAIDQAMKEKGDE